MISCYIQSSFISVSTDLCRLHIPPRLSAIYTQQQLHQLDRRNSRRNHLVALKHAGAKTVLNLLHNLMTRRQLTSVALCRLIPIRQMVQNGLNLNMSLDISILQSYYHH